MPPSDEQGVDIDVELQQYVTTACARLDRVDHYELLEIPRDSDARAIKRAYFRLAAVLHPDRFFGKRLGSYKGGLLTLYGRVTTAYETLSVPARRAAYDASLVASPSPPREPALRFPTARQPSPAAPPPPERQKLAMEALRQRFVDGKAAARQHAEAGARARAAGDHVAAVEAYRAALRLAPEDGALVTALDEAQRGAGDKVVESRRRQAQLEERYGHWAEAAASWRRVTEVRPDDAEARERLAAALARCGGQGGG